MSQTFVKSITHLKDMPRADRALDMLKKIASLVKPIMRKHGWVLPVLSEFFPDSPNLLGLNVNAGQKILVRLRPPNSPDTFLLEDNVVQTMLHELTHNVHGTHDDKFYKFLSGLQDEYDALQRSGYAGEGFYSPGHRLGTNVSHNLPPHQARAKALAAAEKRRKVAAVMGGAGGSKLGGATNLSGPGRGSNLTPRELAARAAERRIRDEKGCGQGDVAEKEAEKAAKGSSITIIDLTQDEGDDSGDSDVIVVDGLTPGPSRTAAVNQPSASKRKRDDSQSVTEVKANPTTSQEWECPTCTLLNSASALLCDACLTEQPKPKKPASTSTSGWTCWQCLEPHLPDEFWSCTFCGAIKDAS